jgi:hypothetical protein
MPDVDKVVIALQQALGELGKARSSASVARKGAGSIEAETTQVGFLGIAAGIRLLGERLDRVLQAQIEVAAGAKGTAAVAQRVTADMNPENVISTLTPAVEQIDAASVSARAILTEVHAAAIQTNESLKGGKPEKMLGLLGEVEQAVALAVARLWDAKAQAEEAIAEARQMGNFLVGMAA